MKVALLIALAVFGILFISFWAWSVNRSGADKEGAQAAKFTLFELFIGFITNFFDTLGVGSFATTSSIFKLKNVIEDELIPGTLNVGHCIPTFVEAFIFVSIIQVDGLTLIAMIASSILGAWIGAGVVSKWPRRTIQIGLGSTLLVAAGLMFLSQTKLLPGGGEALGLTGVKLWIAIIGNFIFGALMTLGIGLFAPCMILVSLLGMNPRAAFPIMMGSCAFLMPVGSIRFIQSGRYSLKAAIALFLGGVPGVLLAAFVVKSLPLDVVRWLVICVVIYTSISLIRSAVLEQRRQKDESAAA
jgi:uncharacterized membrane protein YfcA